MTSTFTFYIEKDSALDTLEAVLAIARRGGLRLHGLNVQAADTDDFVRMDLLAHDSDLLDLFAARLSNVFGVYDIATPDCRPALHIACRN